MQVIFKESASRRHGEVSGKKDIIGKISLIREIPGSCKELYNLIMSECLSQLEARELGFPTPALIRYWLRTAH